MLFLNFNFSKLLTINERRSDAYPRLKVKSLRDRIRRLQRVEANQTKTNVKLTEAAIVERRIWEWSSCGSVFRMVQSCKSAKIRAMIAKRIFMKISLLELIAERRSSFSAGPRILRHPIVCFLFFFLMFMICKCFSVNLSN